MKHNELIILAKEAYRTPINDKKNNGYKGADDQSWEYVTSSDELKVSNDGYFGVAFKKGNDLVIVHRGTYPEFSFRSVSSTN